jgi:hypothetical protein
MIPPTAPEPTGPASCSRLDELQAAVVDALAELVDEVGADTALDRACKALSEDRPSVALHIATVVLSRSADHPDAAAIVVEAHRHVLRGR